jgi:cell division protein FtsI/penicillin-binding protein 2
VEVYQCITLTVRKFGQVAFTPYEDPEVVVVVMIPNGRAASNAALITRRVLEEYYRIKDTQSCFDTIEQVNQLKP